MQYIVTLWFIIGCTQEHEIFLRVTYVPLLDIPDDLTEFRDRQRTNYFGLSQGQGQIIRSHLIGTNTV